MAIRNSSSIDLVTTYQTITQTTSAEFKDRGSKFIAYVFPVQSLEEIKAILKKLKADHPKAVHCCYAYRLGFDKTVYRANDDGEPSGSAGKPILGQIDSHELTQVLVAVIRYFGGVLLGVPGLIHAYKTVAFEAIQLNTIITKDIEQEIRLSFDYTLMNEVMRIIKQFQCTIVKQELLLFCDLTLSVNIQQWETVKQALKKIHGLNVID